MEVLAREAEGGTLRYWLRSLLANADILAGFANPEDRGAAAVVAVGETGAEAILLRTGTFRQARTARDRFAHELAEVGSREFCRRYQLPTHLCQSGDT